MMVQTEASWCARFNLLLAMTAVALLSSIAALVVAVLR